MLLQWPLPADRRIPRWLCRGLEFDALAYVLGERHRIITNDWLAAHMQTLVARLLDRAADMLDRVDLTPAALRADLADARIAPRRLRSVAEMVDHAGDLCGESARLVHDNERRWRVFRERTTNLLETVGARIPESRGGESWLCQPELDQSATATSIGS